MFICENFQVLVMGLEPSHGGIQDLLVISLGLVNFLEESADLLSRRC